MPKPMLAAGIRGFSLIELLVATALGAIVASAVLRIYIDSHSAAHARQARSDLQENGRFALTFLADEIRQAGYGGCQRSSRGLPPNDLIDRSNPVTATLQPWSGIQGWEAAGTAPGTVSNAVAGAPTVASTGTEWSTSSAGATFRIPDVQALPDSDIIRLWAGTGPPARVIGIEGSGADARIRAGTEADIEVDDFLIVSDCENTDFVQACAVLLAGMATIEISLDGACTPGNAAGASLDSVAPAEVIRLQGALYYVGKRGNRADSTPGLFRAVLGADGSTAPGEELIEGVESMQLLYGVNVDQDSNTTVDAWVSADNVADWNHVLAIRISLLIQSVADGVAPSPQPYLFNGINYDGGSGSAHGALPPDRKLRRAFGTTVAIRNRTQGDRGG